MELKDVIHYYLGCQVLHLGKVFIIRAINEKSEVLLFGCSDTNWIHITACKPLLRKLSSMTEEEKTEIAKMWTWYQDITILNEQHFNIRHEINQKMVDDSLIKAEHEYDSRMGPSAYFQIVPYLCKKSFDLWNLIESKQAIDINSADKS